jgi:hypothetical protein
MGRCKGSKVWHRDLLEIQDAGASQSFDLRGRSSDQKEGAGAG